MYRDTNCSYRRLDKNGFDVADTDNFGIRAYAGWCLGELLGIFLDEEALANDKLSIQQQLQHVILSVNRIYQKKSDDEREGALRSKLKIFFDSTTDIVAVNDYLSVKFKFCLNMLDKTLGEESRKVLPFIAILRGQGRDRINIIICVHSVQADQSEW